MSVLRQVLCAVMLSGAIGAWGCAKKSPSDAATKGNVQRQDASEKKSIMIHPYTIPYTAPGEHEDLYRGLSEIMSPGAEAVRVIDYVRKVAKESGYPLSGPELTTYTFEDRSYPLETKIYENQKYYLILFLPKGVPVTSQNLEISVRKGTDEIITILKGS